ncbi:phage portal protein [Paraburkholderia pallida]|uniref:Phage portal protein n=1 Tax=Paraburkholderia pallida TaxID=2547399 RepID=A0A4P7CYC8_9BURK|nr:phage portal protein [Paraburkholderia pallida]QBQ99234.1 phage portal protein [Paraburkholderia pallida]
MSAYAYIQWADVPATLAHKSRQRVDEATKQQLVAFEGCPFAGELEQLAGGRLQVAFPFPINADLRAQMVDWLLHWGISFTVIV